MNVYSVVFKLLPLIVIVAIIIAVVHYTRMYRKVGEKQPELYGWEKFETFAAKAKREDRFIRSIGPYALQLIKAVGKGIDEAFVISEEIKLESSGFAPISSDDEKTIYFFEGEEYVFLKKTRQLYKR